MRNNKWAYIRSCMKDAKEKEVEQPQMTVFLKKSFTSALNNLEELVLDGIDLADRYVVVQLKQLELDLHQLPQQRVLAFDVSTVFEDFEDYVVRFYKLLSIPKQDAETSISCHWVIGRINYALKENREINDSLSILYGIMDSTTERKLRKKKEQVLRHFASNMLNHYLFICYNLIESGSYTIRAMLADATEDLAHLLTSEGHLAEARFAWDLVIILLSQKDNFRITQRAGRLSLAQQMRKYILDY